VSDAELIAAPWYYSVEISPGVLTAGRDHANVAISRRLLRQVSCEGQDCIDLGAQEGIVSVLLKRRGARRVVTYDIVDRSDRVNLLQRAYETDLEYIAGMPIHALPAALDTRGGRFFDLVVFSGVLYHAINPLVMLVTVRGLSRVGGLLLIETAAMQHDEPKLVFNAGARLYGQAVQPNYFVVTTSWLDYVLRMLGLRPLEVAYIGSNAAGSINRVAVLCRSEAGPCPLQIDDPWAGLPEHEALFAQEADVDWPGLRSSRSQIGYTPGDFACGHQSIFDAIAASEPYSFTVDESRLLLSSSL
jgi:2-polyprenyl-3-methyl-5-hydroxy-6-metoxy-1,4-benzoquinol methylase